jgi:hypothetical protein
LDVGFSLSREFSAESKIKTKKFKSHSHRPMYSVPVQMGTQLPIVDSKLDLLIIGYIVTTSDTVSIVFGLTATVLGAGAIWATYVRRETPTIGKLLLKKV